MNHAPWFPSGKSPGSFPHSLLALHFRGLRMQLESSERVGRERSECLGADPSGPREKHPTGKEMCASWAREDGWVPILLGGFARNANRTSAIFGVVTATYFSPRLMCANSVQIHKSHLIYVKNKSPLPAAQEHASR